MNERIEYLDICRGIAVILVVMSHSLCSRAMLFANGFFVPVFYFIAGYLSSGRISLVKKARRLLIPYLVLSVLIAAAAVLSGMKDIGWKDVAGVLYSRYALYPLGTEDNVVLLGLGNSPLWFLTSMFLSFLTFAVLCRSGKYAVWMALAYVAVTVVMKFLPVLLPWSLDTAFLTGLFMYSGKVVRQYGILEKGWSVPALMLAAYAASLLVNGYGNLSVREYGKSVLLCLASGISGSIVLLKLSHLIDNTFLHRPLAAIGRNSLVIFCMQIPFLQIILKVSSLAGIQVPTGFVEAAVAGVQVIAAVACGYLLSRILSRFMPSVI